MSSSSSSAEPHYPSTFNRAQLEDLEQAEDFLRFARQAPFQAALAGVHIGDTEVNHLAGLCLHARRRTASAVRQDTAGETETLQATGAERALVILLQRIQAAAKQKYARRNPVKLQDYFIGQRLNPNDALLHQHAFSIAESLTPPTGTDLATAPDQLPGIGLDVINQLRGMIDLSPAPLPPEGSAPPATPAPVVPVPPDAPADREERDRLIKEINDRRIEGQFAIDGLYPYTSRDPIAREARRAFGLPLSRPFNG